MELLSNATAFAMTMSMDAAPPPPPPPQQQGNMLGGQLLQLGQMGGQMGGVFSGAVDPLITQKTQFGRGSSNRGGGGKGASTAPMTDWDYWQHHPSDWLREFGDPLAAAGRKGHMTHGVDGNWACNSCGNVNFPRRTDCNKCKAKRDESGDQVVREYVFRVMQERTGNLQPVFA